MSSFLSPRFSAMRPYVPGEQPQDQQYIKLNTNESPYPPPAPVLAAAQAEAEKLNLYSDPDDRIVREKIAALYGVDVGCVLATNGSDEALHYIILAYGDADRPFAFPDITYGFYPVVCNLYGLPYEEIPLRLDFTVDLNACVENHYNLIIANPNAPTGIALTREEIRVIAASNPRRLVVVDEAYVDFGAESCVPLTKELDNLLVVQTFSKSRSLAGARLGFAIGNEALIAELNAVRCSLNPYNVNRMTLAAGAAAIDCNEFFMENCRRIMATREETRRQLANMGFEILPSKTNFLFARRPGLPGADYYRLLKERGILIRHFTGARIADYARITMGNPEQMQALIDTTKKILEEGQK
ncbi:MAG: histidinol-phosphate transaminase [Clostridia bacterium]|nr:histidinol-phosphate transaminase [Clostridia bacterium]